MRALIRWVSPLDFDGILEVEQLSSEVPLSKDELELYTGSKDTGQHVLIYNNDILGYLLYQEYPLALSVIRLCIHPCSRRRGLGTLLLNKLREILYFGTQNRIVFAVYDTNLDGQLFLKSQGCIATKISPHNPSIYIFEYNSPLELLMKKAHYIYIVSENVWTNHKWVISDNLIKLKEEEIRQNTNVVKYLELLAKGEIE